MQAPVNATSELYDAQHLLALGGIAMAVALVAVAAGAGTRQRYLGFGIAVALIAQEAFKLWFHGILYDEPIGRYLPLHLCGASALLMSYVLVRRSYAGFEVGYFWGLGGSTQALLTPDIQAGFPTPVFLSFFIGHGLVIASVVFAIAAFRFQPTARSLLRTLWITLAYLAAIAPLNVLLDANYLYLRQKPEQPSIIDFLGPWPWYIATLVVVGAAICGALYAPFAIRDRLARRPGGGT